MDNIGASTATYGRSSPPAEADTPKVINESSTSSSHAELSLSWSLSPQKALALLNSSLACLFDRPTDRPKSYTSRSNFLRSEVVKRVKDSRLKNLCLRTKWFNCLRIFGLPVDRQGMKFMQPLALTGLTYC